MSPYRVEQIAVNLIDWPKNDRGSTDPKKLADLVESVRANGVIQPISVIADGRGRFTGEFGERRLTAARAAGLATIPAIVREAARSATDEMVVKLTENVARESLPAMDVAEALQRLTTAGGLTAGQAGQRVGMSASEVSKSLKLNQLPKGIQDQVRSGAISPGAAYVLAQVEDPAAQAELARQVADGKLGRDQLTAHARRARRASGTRTPTASTQRVAAELGDGRSVIVNGPGVDTMDGLIRCLEDMLARARKARPQGIEVRTFAKMLRDQAKRSAAGSGAKQA